MYFFLVLLTTVSLVCAQETPLPPSPGEITRWVDELDSDLFDTRERAQKQLTRCGEAALEAVAEEARNGSLESSTRAINILLAWSESEDGQLVIASLERLSTFEQHPKQARLARELLADVRENLALKAFKELGGEYQQIQQVNGVVLPRPMRNLQIILSSDWKGGTDGLKLLEQMPSVTTVSFHSPPLGDEALSVLEKLPELKRVELYGVKRMTTEALAELPQKLPNVRPDQIDIRGPAFLGVRGTIFGENAQVGLVVPGSAADQAGVKPGDIITKLDGQEIKDFVTLTQLISNHQAGDSVMLSIMRPQPNRPPESLELKVSFAQWGVNGAGATLPEGEGADGQTTPQTGPAKIRLDRR